MMALVGKSGRREEAQAALEQMAQLLQSAQDVTEADRLKCQEAYMECQEGHLESPAYLELLESVSSFSTGKRSTWGPWGV